MLRTMGGCVSGNVSHTDNEHTKEKYEPDGERRVHWNKPLVIKKHKVKRNAGDSRKSCWLRTRTESQEDALEIKCEELLDSSKQHFRRISRAIKQSEDIADRIKKNKVIQAIDATRDENQRQRMMDQLDGASTSLMHLSKINAQRMEMTYRERNELDKLQSVVQGLQSRAQGQSKPDSAIGGAAPEQPEGISS